MGDALGFIFPAAKTARSGNTAISEVMRQRPLHRVLSFTGRTIDDIVNDPIAKNEVLGYFKLHREVNRRCEIVELERQWNSPR